MFAQRPRPRPSGGWLRAIAALAIAWSAPGRCEDRAAAPAPIPLAVIDDTLEVTGDTIGARAIRTRLFVRVEVNGQGPFNFLVDSGADRSAIGANLAERLALPAEGHVVVQGMAGASRVETVMLDRLKVGASAISNVVAPALPEAHLGAQGLIGIDALAEQRVMLDFDARLITIQDGRRRAAMLSDEIVVVARRRKGQLIMTEASVEGHRIHAVIDTGAEVTVANSALRAKLLRGRRVPVPHPITLVSVTGQTLVADLVVLSNVRLGGITLNGVPIAFVDAPPFALFGLDTAPAVLLGTDVLEAFRRVSLDFRNRKVRFQLRR